MFVRIITVCAAFTIAYLFERWLDLGVIAALAIGAAALVALACGVGLRPTSSPRPQGRPEAHTTRRSAERVLAEIAVLMPFAGLFHIDPQWRRVTIGLYLGYLGLVVITAWIRRRLLRRKSAAGAA